MSPKFKAVGKGWPRTDKPQPGRSVTEQEEGFREEVRFGQDGVKREGADHEARVERKEHCARQPGSELRAGEAVAQAAQPAARQRGAAVEPGPAARVAAAGAVVRQEYGGGTAEGFGPTLAAEHLANDHGIEQRCQWMLAEGLWKRRRKRHGGGSGRRISALLQLDAITRSTPHEPAPCYPAELAAGCRYKKLSR